MMEVEENKLRHRKRHLSSSYESIEITSKHLKTDDGSADLNLSFHSEKSSNEAFNCSSISIIEKLNDFQLNMSIESTTVSIDLSPINDKFMKTQDKKCDKVLNQDSEFLSPIAESSPIFKKLDSFKTPKEQTLSLKDFQNLDKNNENYSDKSTILTGKPIQRRKSLGCEVLNTLNLTPKLHESSEESVNLLDMSNASFSLPENFEFITSRPPLNRIKSLPTEHLMSPIFYQHRNSIFPAYLNNQVSPLSANSKLRNHSHNFEPYPITYMSCHEIAKIINNDFTNKSLSYHIIDCRYPYEFDGGHLLGAINLYTPWQLLNYIFFPNNPDIHIQKLIDPTNDFNKLIDDIKRINKPNSCWKNCAFIFHCEFSSIRGPKMAECLRTIDRILNITSYPELFFPHIYILSKGYKDFFTYYPNLCVPNHYVKMEEIDSTIYETEKEVAEAYERAIVAAEEGHPIVEGIDPQVLKMRYICYSQCKSETQNQMIIFSTIISDKIDDQHR